MSTVLLPDKPKKTKKKTKQPKSEPSVGLSPLGSPRESESHQGTKARFDELLRQAAEQSQLGLRDGKASKKKKRQTDSILTSLKEAEGLKKEEDHTLLANTYDPDNSPKNEKSNKRRQLRLRDTGVENSAFLNDEKILLSQTKKTKKKINDSSEIISDLAPSPVTSPRGRSKGKKGRLNTSAEVVAEESQQNAHDTAVQESQDMTGKSPRVKSGKVSKGKSRSASRTRSPRGEILDDATEHKDAVTTDVIKKRKKKKTTAEVKEESEEDVLSPRTEEEEDPEIDIQSRTTKLKKKKKRKKQDAAAEVDIEAGPSDTSTDRPIEEADREVEDEGSVLGIIVHRTDKLKNDFYISHPLVRIHVVDEMTGTYVKKQHRERAVTSYYEQSSDNVDYILPIMTQPFDFKQKRSALPVWEELLLFNENYNYFVQEQPKVIIFFELLDFVSMGTASKQYSHLKQEGGWHRIAWAFLKIVGKNNKINSGSKVRLQLFQPPSCAWTKKDQVELYHWWKETTRSTYPSTLYVTMKSLTPPEKVEPSYRSMFATQEELSRTSYQDFKARLDWEAKSREELPRKLTSWSRLAGQVCKVPNNLLLSLPGGRKGCYVLKFSHDGRNLACACQDNEGFSVLVYEIPSGVLRGRFLGHFGIIYDLCWAKLGTHLLSSSSDGTARVWNLLRFGDRSEKVLPHPGFVYTSKFHPRVDCVIVTGGYDQVIRVWNIQSDDQHGQLLQEMDNHQGHINSVCFDDDGSKLFSADSVGTILIWNVFVSDQPSRRGFLRDWTLFQEVQDPDIKGVAINCLRLHPSGRRLLVHCRDNILRMFDLRVQRIMQKFIGALNFREQIHSTISPCGTFIFSGSEDACAYVWNAETGDQVAMYSELNYRHPVTDVDYHPRDHIIAFSSLGDNQSVFLYNYDPQVAAIAAGFVVKSKEEATEPSAAAVSSSKKASAISTTEEFELNETARMEKVMKKLNSVTLATQPMIPADQHPLGQTFSPRQGTGGSLSTWGSTFDRSAFMQSSLGMNGVAASFSPHAPQSMNSTIHQQQFASQSLYQKQTDGWRPTFSNVRGHGKRSGSPTYYGRPQMNFNLGEDKPQFTFLPSSAKPVSHQQEERVVALYDYRAQRSDELTLIRGDVISVLYKDNENWWMGELVDGQQGFFPANYVVSPDNDKAPVRSQSIDHNENNSTKKKTVTALNSNNGELKFFSGTDDSEIETTPKRRTRKKEKSDDIQLNGMKSQKHVKLQQMAESVA